MYTFSTRGEQAGMEARAIWHVERRVPAVLWTCLVHARSTHTWRARLWSSVFYSTRRTMIWDSWSRFTLPAVYSQRDFLSVCWYDKSSASAWPCWSKRERRRWNLCLTLAHPFWRAIDSPVAESYKKVWLLPHVLSPPLQTQRTALGEKRDPGDSEPGDPAGREG